MPLVSTAVALTALDHLAEAWDVFLFCGSGGTFVFLVFLVFGRLTGDREFSWAQIIWLSPACGAIGGAICAIIHFLDALLS